ncbi:hypothetical protein CspeluHIS016_0300930 [Cutaneotrichosporon spelunceum]|uniref:Multifunctional fusion protein n=1 Tax=Cutaneotrichosporon spelunceum TaxID=1672016 RepID=A0AAD3TT98_9TREE|nr:hypothetical protein CspeluHIS016_0300930 [Cutaneotrichosporon spelunceum]
MLPSPAAGASHNKPAGESPSPPSPAAAAPLCTSCAYPAPYVYTTYTSRSNIRLSVCSRCSAFVDPLIEAPPLLLVLDLVLLKPRVFLHLLYNRASPPRDARSVGTVSTPEHGSYDRASGLRADLIRLGAATLAAEVASRLADHPELGVIRVTLVAALELAAQLATSTAVTLAILRLHGWYPPTSKGVPDGRRDGFRPILVPLVLLYTALLPIVLRLVLRIWYTPTFSDPALGFTGLLAAHAPRLAAEVDALAKAWGHTDRVWAGTRLLGGMNAPDMRAVVQKVVNASVAVDGKTISEIGRGLMILVGINRDDTNEDRDWIIKKVLAAKLWDGDDAWRNSVTEIEGEVLCVSQFTLFANFKGARPDFHDSMSTIPGKAMYTSFLEKIGAAYRPDRIKDGEFGAMMAVSLTNDGPVTIIFDSKDRQGSRRSAPGSGASTPGQPQPPPKGSLAAEEIAKAKIAAKKAKKAEWEARKARGEIPAKGAFARGEISAAKKENEVEAKVAELSIGEQ